MMNIEQIREYLPHRYPFLLVDRVESLTLGESIVALKNVTANEPFFEGHFPEYSVMPGVLIVEAMAQAAGILGFKTQNTKPSDGYLYLFVGCDNLRFKRQVVPGDQLRLEANVVSERRGIWKFECKATVGDELACAATILCAHRPVPKFTDE